MSDLLGSPDPGLSERRREAFRLEMERCHALGIPLLVGLATLRAIHLNDSRRPRGSHLDRHAPIGEGFLGLRTFRRLLADVRLAHVPKVLETPGGLPAWKRELALPRRRRR